MTPAPGETKPAEDRPVPAKRETKGTRGRRLQWRALLRAVHRDLGYTAVGLTFVYAASGLAVDHIGDWDPSFSAYQASHELGPVTGKTDDDIANLAKTKLGITEEARDVFRASASEIDVTFDKRTIHVNPENGHVDEEGQKPRFFLRVANWLHLNRGKKAWRYFADSYAVSLLFLASSGLFMIAGKKGLFGRGAVFVLIGVVLPAAYVVLSGGP
jgi:hypothetical protein